MKVFREITFSLEASKVNSRLKIVELSSKLNASWNNFPLPANAVKWKFNVTLFDIENYG